MTTFEPRARWMRRLTAWPVCAGLLLSGWPARAAEQTIELSSRGGYQSHRLPDGTTDVELAQQTGGGCRFGRTWGFDLTNQELWVDGGCSGRFRVTTSGAASGSTAGSDADSSSDKSNVGAAVAAAALIAGIALIASKDKDRDRDDGGDWQDGGWNGRQIRGKGGLCLDIEGGARPGRNLIVYGCNNGGNQRFEWTRGGELRVGGLCLDVADRNPEDGARVMAYTCNGGSNQRWQARGGQIRSRDTGKCLDLESGRARPGQPVIMYRCNGGENQRWAW